MSHRTVEDFFKEITDEFTIFVVEKRFAVERGRSFFEQYRNTQNYISSYQNAENFIKRVLSKILKYTPDVADLVQNVFTEGSLDIASVITSFSKLFSVYEHQAAGPEIIDPIIIEENFEGMVESSQINQIITLHSQSLLRPRIILILKDNNFERAKKLLSSSPNGIKIKFIKNDGSEEFGRVLNSGVDNINDFLDVYSRQCFDACSKTATSVISNSEWAQDSIIKEFGPFFLQSRSMLLYGEKLKALRNIDKVVSSIEQKQIKNKREEQILLGFECFGKLFRVFCNDFGGEDIKKAEEISKNLNNCILTAHVYRYAPFMKGKNEDDIFSMLEIAEKVFSENRLEDHSIYCKNNLLFRYFYQDIVPNELFLANVERVVQNVPGLIGASIIFNNAGVAAIYNGDYDSALKFFYDGLDKNPQTDHRLGLKTNILIAKYLSGLKVLENDIENLIDEALIMSDTSELAFLTANTITNALSICLKMNEKLAYDFFNDLKIQLMYQNALLPDKPSRNSLMTQLNYMQNKYKKLNLAIDHFNQNTHTRGVRGRFLERKGLNPAIYNAWL